jgi:hypothetical protein
MTTAMKAKEYRLIAGIIQQAAKIYPTSPALRFIQARLTTEFRRENPKFSVTKFTAACNPEESNEH